MAPSATAGKQERGHLLDEHRIGVKADPVQERGSREADQRARHPQHRGHVGPSRAGAPAAQQLLDVGGLDIAAREGGREFGEEGIVFHICYIAHMR